MPGEWYKNWITNKNNSEGAEWIYNNADMFILFVDCQALVGNERGLAREKIINLSKRLSSNLDNRAVAVVWSKFKYFQVKDEIKNRIKDEFKRNFKIYKEFEVNNIPKKDNDEYCYKNIPTVLNWCLEYYKMRSNNLLDLNYQYKAKDLFFYYKGK